MSKVVTAQLIVVVLTGAAFMTKGTDFALAALYGGAVAVVNSLLLARRVARASQQLAPNPRADVLSMYIGAVERFALTVVAMAVGLAWLKLNPVPVVVSFGMAYLGYVIGHRLTEGGKNATPTRP